MAECRLDQTYSVEMTVPSGASEFDERVVQLRVRISRKEFIAVREHSATDVFRLGYVLIRRDVARLERRECSALHCRLQYVVEECSAIVPRARVCHRTRTPARRGQQHDHEHDQPGDIGDRAHDSMDVVRP